MRPLLASVAGAIIGSYIGNKLFNNQNYQNQRRTSYKSPQTYSRSVDSFNKAKNSFKCKNQLQQKKVAFLVGIKGQVLKVFFGG